VEETSTNVDLQYAAARILEGGHAAKEVFEGHEVKVRTARSASLITLIVDNREVATFGPGHPLECADALNGFITHLVTRTIAEA
jgi:hypothetical protein